MLCGHQAGEEVPPRAGGLGVGLGGGVDRAVAAGLGEQARGRCRCETAISAVMANHSRVWPASRAALETCLRLAMLTITAVTISGGTSDLQQRDERAADGLEGAGQPVGRAVGDGAHLPGDEAEDDAHDEGEEDLRRERDAAETSEHESGAFRKRCERGRRERRGVNRPAVVTRPKSRARRRVRPHRFCTEGSMRTPGRSHPACGDAHGDGLPANRQRVGLPVKSPSVSAMTRYRPDGVGAVDLAGPGSRRSCRPRTWRSPPRRSRRSRRGRSPVRPTPSTTTGFAGVVGRDACSGAPRRGCGPCGSAGRWRTTGGRRARRPRPA